MTAAILFALAITAQSPLRPELIAQLSSDSSVMHVSLSPDGNQALVAGSSGTPRIWDTHSGLLLHVLPTHKDNVLATAYAASGRFFATGSSDHTIALWDALSRARIVDLTVGGISVERLAISSDGKFLAEASSDHSVYLFSAKSPDSPKVFKATEYSCPVAFAPSGHLFAFVAPDGVAIYDPDAGALKETLPFKDLVFSTAFSRDGSEIALAGYGKVTTWNLASNREEKVEVVPGSTEVAWTTAGLIAIADMTDEMSVWTFNPAVKRCVLTKHHEGLNDFAISDDGSVVASAGVDGQAEFYDSRTGKTLSTATSLGSVSPSVSFASHRQILVQPADRWDSLAHHVKGPTSEVRIWDLITGAPHRITGVTPSLASALSPDGKHAAWLDQTGTVVAWNLDTGKSERSFPIKASAYVGLAISPDGKMLAGSSEAKALFVWSLATGATLLEKQDSGIKFCQPSFSPKSDLLLSPEGGVTKVLRTSNWETVATLKNDGPACGSAFTADGKLAVIANGTGGVEVFRVSDWAKIHVFKVSDNELGLLDVSPDSKMAIVGTIERGPVLVDLVSGKEGPKIEGASEIPLCNLFSPDGRFIATAGPDGFCHITDAKTGRAACSLISFDDGTWAVVDPAGRYDAPNAGDIAGLHWVVGNDAIELAQFRDVYYTRGLLGKIWRGEKLPPVPAIENVQLYPLSQVEIAGDKATVKLRNRGGGIGLTRVLLNGVQIAEFNRNPAKPDFDPNLAEKTLEVSLAGLPSLGSGRDRVTALVWNAEGSLRSRAAEPAIASEPAASANPTGYYAVIAGVGDYAGPGVPKLEYAGADAVSTAKALLVAAKGIPGVKPVIYLLCDSPEAKALAGNGVIVLNPDRNGFDTAFGALGEPGRVKDTDLLFVYLSGHGVALHGARQGYAYLTMNARSADSASLANTDVRREWTITDDDLVSYLRPIAALKKVLVLDTCAAGAIAASALTIKAADEDPTVAAADLRDRTGFHVLLASAADQFAYEAPEYGHGFLTYTMLWTLKNDQLGDLRAPDSVQVDSLFQHVRTRVEGIARENRAYQAPLILAPRGETFPIGYLSALDRAEIALSDPRPVLGRAAIVDLAAGELDAALTKSVNEGLRHAFGEGRRAAAHFVDNDEAPGLITLSGSYVVQGGEIVVTFRLRKEGKVLGKPNYRVRGKRENVPSLVVTFLSENLAAIAKGG